MVCFDPFHDPMQFNNTPLRQGFFVGWDGMGWGSFDARSAALLRLHWAGCLATCWLAFFGLCSPVLMPIMPMRSNTTSPVSLALCYIAILLEGSKSSL